MKKITFFLYGFFLCTFTLFSYFFVDSNIVYLHNLYTGFDARNRELTTVVYTIYLILFFIFYILFLYLSYNKKLTMREITILIGMTISTLLFSYPAMLSFDIFNYILTAKVLFHYHENPYIIMPIELIKEPFLVFTRAANKTALYGPLWLILSGIPYSFGLGNFIFILFNFKLLATFFYILTGIVFFKLTKNIFSVVLFMLNPLVIIEILVSAHNDIVMVFFVMLAFLFFIKNRVKIAWIFLLISVGIKYASVFLVPIFLYATYLYIQKKPINWSNIFLWSFFSMLAVFLISPIREEIYPWYAIWFLAFLPVLWKKKTIITFSLIFSTSLMFRYVPVMYFGTYLEPTIFIKKAFSFVPVTVYGIYFFLKKKI